MATRIGPQMAAVVSFVARNPGCVKIDAARHVAPGRSGRGLGFGYWTVDRAFNAGLIEIVYGKGNRQHLYLPGAAK